MFLRKYRQKFDAFRKTILFIFFGPFAIPYETFYSIILESHPFGLIGKSDIKVNSLCKWSFRIVLK